MSKVKSETQIEHDDFEIIFDVSDGIEKYVSEQQDKRKPVAFTLGQIAHYLKQNTSCYKKYDKADVNETIKFKIKDLSKGKNSRWGYMPPTVAPAIVILLNHVKPTRKIRNVKSAIMPKKIYSKLSKTSKLNKYKNDYLLDNVYMIYSELQQEYMAVEQNLKNDYDLHINDLKDSVDAIIKSVMKSPYCESDKKNIIKKYTKDIHNAVDNEVKNTQKKYQK